MYFWLWFNYLFCFSFSIIENNFFVQIMVNIVKSHRVGESHRIDSECHQEDTGRRLLAKSYCKGGHHHKMGAGNWDHHPGNRRFITNFKIKDVKEVMMEEN